MGAQVRGGERGTLCAYFDRIARDARGRTQVDGGAALSDDAAKDRALRRTGLGDFLAARPFRLFNVAQIDGPPCASAVAFRPRLLERYAVTTSNFCFSEYVAI